MKLVHLLTALLLCLSAPASFAGENCLDAGLNSNTNGNDIALASNLINGPQAPVTNTPVVYSSGQGVTAN